MNDAELERLFKAYHVPLVRYLTRRLGDRDWAEEVAQETFLRALRQSNLTNERAWLFAVATNLVRDDARREDRRRKQLRLLAEETRDVQVESAETTLERAQETALARKAIDGLLERIGGAPDAGGRGLNYEESRGVRLSVGSIGTTLARARRRLVESYEAMQSETKGGVGGGHAAS